MLFDGFVLTNKEKNENFVAAVFKVYSVKTYIYINTYTDMHKMCIRDRDKGIQGKINTNDIFIS